MQIIRKASEVRSFIAPENIKALKNLKIKDMNTVRALAKIGLDGLEDYAYARVASGARAMHGMDSIQPSVTQGSITTPVQFLQNWLPGFVKVITAARKIDLLVGIATVGSWEDEQVIQGIIELLGTSVPYGDFTTVPFSSWNTNFVTRTVVRFEEGMMVPVLENMRAARIQVDSGAAKRESAALALEIQRNAIGFFGFNSGNNLTYGFLNDPGLPAYVTFPNGASASPAWSTKTYLEITHDIQLMAATLQAQAQDQINPNDTALTLVVPTGVFQYFSTVSQFGNSVWEFIEKSYPKMRVESAPELTGANGGANAAYMYADSIDDLSTDDGRTFIQPVPAKFMVLGVAQQAKAYQEDYSNATAGTMCKRPWAVRRYSGC